MALEPFETTDANIPQVFVWTLLEVPKTSCFSIAAARDVELQKIAIKGWSDLYLYFVHRKLINV